MTELTAEMIVDFAVPQELDISPDGTRVAYALSPNSKKEEHATSSLWVATTDGSRAARQFTRGDVEDHKPKWSPDSSQIAFLSDRDKRGTAQLYLIASDGGEARPLMPKTNKKPVEDFAWSPGGGQIAFTSADEPTAEDERREKERDDADVYGERWPYARLRLFSIATGEVSTLVSGDRHVASFAWSPGGTELAYVAQQNPSREAWAHETVIERVAIAGGEAQQVRRFPGAIFSLAWSSDGETLLLLAPVEPRLLAPFAIYVVLVQGGEPRRIAPGAEQCAGGLQQPVTARQAAVAIWEGLETRICWLDTATGEFAPLSPTKAEYRAASIPDWTVRVVEGRETVFAAARGSGNQPWEVWAGRSEGQSEIPVLQQVTAHQSALSSITFGPQEAFTWSAPDGWELDGILVRPPDVPGDHPLPTVMLVHGGPYGRWGHEFYLHALEWAQWLALAGYVVLMPNPRGGSGHGERFANAVRGDAGGADYADVMSALDAAIERGIADPDRLGIGGWSQGGFMTAWAVTQTKRFKAAIMGAGVSDWGMMVMTSRMPDFQRVLGGSAPWEGAGPHPHARYSPISFAREAKTPVLILHGQEDPQVPVSQAMGFHRALREQRVPTELVVYPREPHSISERAHQLDVLKRVRGWYDRWLRS